MVATPIILRATPRIRSAPPRWTFTSSVAPYNAYSGINGLHTPSTGGMTDSDDLSNSSIWATDSSSAVLTASFGTAAYYVTQVICRNIDSTHPDGWTLVSTYTDGRSVYRSIDGLNWTLIGVTSGAADGVNIVLSTNAFARFIQIRNTSSFFGLGCFRFT